MTIALRALGVVLAAAALGLLASASRAPLRLSGGEAAILRLSIGARPQRIETCRTVSDEELARVLPQMRQRLVCEGTTARYRLEIRRDSTLLFQRVVRGGGLRHDRRLYVFAELPLPEGTSRLHVRLVALDTLTHRGADSADAGPPAPGADAERVARERDVRRRTLADAVPPALEIDQLVTVAAGDVILLTYRPEKRQLALAREPR